MKLTVLGKNGPFPRAGGACSGYLLESGDVRLVLDMGNGTLSRLLQACGLERISAVLLSHLHSDHMSDMLILRYALAQLRARGKDVPMPLSVITPSEPEAEFRQLASFGVYDMTLAEDGMRLRFGDLSVTLHRMIHPVPSFAFSITDGEKRFFYTGDTAYFPQLAELCEGHDLLLADSGLLSSDKTTMVAAHMTAKEVGEIARDARVKRLLCTHIWGGYQDDEVLAEAKEAFPEAEVAHEGETYEI
ncbi:MAG: MBL fold metallo-hydrolase [Bacillota bacterium]